MHNYVYILLPQFQDSSPRLLVIIAIICVSSTNFSVAWDLTGTVLLLPDSQALPSMTAQIFALKWSLSLIGSVHSFSRNGVVERVCGW